MDRKRFEYIKRYLATGVIDHLMKTKGWSEDEAVRIEILGFSCYSTILLSFF